MELKCKKGNISITTSLFVMVLSIILAWGGITNYRLAVISNNTRDMLTTTNLAVFKNIDLARLGEDEKTIVIKNPIAALNTYEEHLKYNFKLNNNLTCSDQNDYVKGTVKIEKFIIYNVENDKIHVITVDPSANTYSESISNKGTVQTPRGNTVDTTTVYSCISFDVNTIFNNTQHVSIDEASNITNVE